MRCPPYLMVVVGLMSASQLACGEAPRAQRAAPLVDGFLTLSSRDGHSTMACSRGWAGALDGELVPEGDGGLALDAEVVAVRFLAGAAVKIAAFDNSDGRRRWTSEGTGDATLRPLLPLVIGAKALLDVRSGPDGARAALYDLETGARTSEVVVDASLVVKRAEALGEGFILIGSSRAQVIAPTGKVTMIDTRGDVCVDGARAWALGRSALLAFDVMGQVRELDVTPPPSGAVVACGQRGAQLVFLVTQAAEARWEVQMVNGAGGAVTAFGGTGALNESALTRVEATRWSDAAWHGALPAAVPLVVGDGDSAEPLIIDLEGRRVRHLATASPRWKLAGMTRFGAGHVLIVERWIVGLSADGRVFGAKQIEGAAVGPSMADGHSIAWVDAEGRAKVFREAHIDQLATSVAALAEARRELGLEPE